jgi:hypothetical protein
MIGDDNDPLFPPGWPASTRVKQAAQSAPGGYGLKPTPSASDEEIVTLVVSTGKTLDEGYSYLRGWRQVR